MFAAFIQHAPAGCHAIAQAPTLGQLLARLDALQLHWDAALYSEGDVVAVRFGDGRVATFLPDPPDRPAEAAEAA